MSRCPKKRGSVIYESSYVPPTARYSYRTGYSQCSTQRAKESRKSTSPHHSSRHSLATSFGGLAQPRRSIHRRSTRDAARTGRRRGYWQWEFLAVEADIRDFPFQIPGAKFQCPAVRHTSLLPRPNPLITGPDNRTGYGLSGPASGPATGSRGLSGRILILFFLDFYSHHREDKRKG